jgi:hypothetical protein
MGAKVTLTVDARLIGLLGRALPGVTVVADGTVPAVEFDYHTPIGSLPRWVRTTRDRFRPMWSTLVPDRAQVIRWQERLAGLPDGARVGICWRSGMLTPERRRCYATLAEWEPVLRLPGVTWVNLQYDECEAELVEAERAFGVRIHRWPAVDLKRDLEAVTALIWHLDLVVTAPTAVSSLAGAVGVETWELDGGTDWTVFGEDRSPWFPAIRLARRPPGTVDWGPALTTVADDIRARLARPTAAATR